MTWRVQTWLLLVFVELGFCVLEFGFEASCIMVFEYARVCV